MKHFLLITALVFFGASCDEDSGPADRSSSGSTVDESDFSDLDEGGGEPVEVVEPGTGEGVSFNGLTLEEAMEKYSKDLIECIQSGKYYALGPERKCDQTIDLSSESCEVEDIKAGLDDRGKNDLDNLLASNPGYEILACLDRDDGGKEVFAYSKPNGSTNKIDFSMSCVILGQTTNSSTCPKLD